MHHRLYSNQQALEPWDAHARALGLDLVKFDDCMNSEREATKIRREMAEGQKAGVSGTPTFFFAYTDPKSSQVKTVTRLTGAQPFATFKATIDKLLAEK